MPLTSAALNWTPLRRRRPARPQVPGQSARFDPAPELFYVWLAEASLLAFALWFAWRAGALFALNEADPFAITKLMFVLLFVGIAWCGHRSWRLDRELRAVELGPRTGGDTCWCDRYWAARNAAQNETDRTALVDVLSERAHGKHETAWWLNGLLLKLGLLGTVAGFILMTLEVSATSAFDVSQAQGLLKAMTYGMGISLYKTLVGLAANIILGWQLHRLDRAADWLVTQTIERAAWPEPSEQGAGHGV